MHAFVSTHPSNLYAFVCLPPYSSIHSICSSDLSWYYFVYHSSSVYLFICLSTHWFTGMVLMNPLFIDFVGIIPVNPMFIGIYFIRYLLYRYLLHRHLFHRYLLMILCSIYASICLSTSECSLLPAAGQVAGSHSLPQVTGPQILVRSGYQPLVSSH